jgi:hypothetical protein
MQELVCKNPLCHAMPEMEEWFGKEKKEKRNEKST